MEKKLWIALAVICVVIVIIALILLLFLVPQVKNTGLSESKYENIAKQEYTYSGMNEDKLLQQYSVTEDAVNRGKNQKRYKEGNINPFTPNTDVTIYNEPTKKVKQSGSKGNLTPSDK